MNKKMLQKLFPTSDDMEKVKGMQTPQLIDLIRKQLPGMIAKDLTSVQPMGNSPLFQTKRHVSAEEACKDESALLAWMVQQKKLHTAIWLEEKLDYTQRRAAELLIKQGYMEYNRQRYIMTAEGINVCVGLETMEAL